MTVRPATSYGTNHWPETGGGTSTPEPENTRPDFDRNAANFARDGTTSPEDIIRALEPIEKATSEAASTDRLNVYPGGTAAFPTPIAGQSFEFAIKARGGDVVTPLGTVPDGFIQHYSSIDGGPVEGTASLLIDEDDFASNSDTRAPTQQSTKAYADRILPFIADIGWFKSGGALDEAGSKRFNLGAVTLTPKDDDK